jgi:hypothetical protein
MLTYVLFAFTEYFFMAPNSAFDLLGVTALLGTEVAQGALRYANTDRSRVFMSFLVVPGLYGISSQMLKRSYNRIALILSPGEREDRRKIVGFSSSATYKYVGMHSGTTASVQNALFEAWLNRQSTVEAVASKIFMEGSRPTIVSTVSCTRSDADCPIFLNATDDNCPLFLNKWIVASSLLLQFATLVILIQIIRTGDITAIIITILNMLSYFMIILSLSCDTFKIPDATPSQEVPPGDSLITHQNGTNIWAVKGNEKNIQNLMQLEVVVESKDWKSYLEVLACVTGCITSIVTVLFAATI